MTITTEAVFHNGQLQFKEPVPLTEGTPVRVAITPLDEDYDPLDEVVGICTEGPDMSLAERHDAIVYGGLLRKGSAVQ